MCRGNCLLASQTPKLGRLGYQSPSRAVTLDKGGTHLGHRPALLREWVAGRRMPAAAAPHSAAAPRSSGSRSARRRLPRGRPWPRPPRGCTRPAGQDGLARASGTEARRHPGTQASRHPGVLSARRAPGHTIIGRPAVQAAPRPRPLQASAAASGNRHRRAECR